MPSAVPVILSGPVGQRIVGGAYPPGGAAVLSGGVLAADAVASGVLSSAPAPSPAPPPPPPTLAPAGAGISFTRSFGDGTKMLVFNADFEGGRYERYQYHKTIDARSGVPVNMAFTGRNLDSDVRALLGTSYSLIRMDTGEVLDTKPATAGVTTSLTFAMHTGTLPSDNWVVLDIVGNGPGEISLPFPVFVRKTVAPADPALMPVRRAIFEFALGGRDFALGWVPAQFVPTEVPLEARTFEDFNTAVTSAALYRELLVPGQGGMIRRPNRTSVADGAVLNTSNRQSYDWSDYNNRYPAHPLLDGPRGRGTLNMAGHVAPAAAAPGGVRRRTTYFCDPWRFGKVAEDGSIKTLAGVRHKGVGRYWQDSMAQAPVAANPSNPDGTLELVGDWSAIATAGAPVGFWALWGMAWDERTLGVDLVAPPVGTPPEAPHFVGPRAFVTDTKNDRVCRIQFNAADRADPVITELYRGHTIGANPAGLPTAEPWDIVFNPATNTVYVSERRLHRIVERSADTGALIRVVVQGLALGTVGSGVSPQLNGGVTLADARAADVVLPEGLFLQDGFLYFGSIIQQQISKVEIATGTITKLVQFNRPSGAEYCKIAVSDGTFLPRGTILAANWDQSLSGYPLAWLPNGTVWNILPGINGVVQRGRTNGLQGGLGNYNSSVGVGFGRLICAASTEGLVEFSLAKASDPPAFDHAVLMESAGNPYSGAVEDQFGTWSKGNLDLLHQGAGFGWYGLPKPWGYSFETDLYLQSMGHVPPALPAWVPATIGQGYLAPITNTAQSVFTGGVMGTQSAKIGEYSGGPYNRYASQYGRFEVRGSGHAAMNWDGHLSVDMTTLAWIQSLAPTDLQALGKWVNYEGTAFETGLLANSYDYFHVYGSQSTGWADPTNIALRQYPAAAEITDPNGAESQPGRPGAPHSYDAMFVWPPHKGGGVKGSLVQVIQFAVGARASRGSAYAYAFDVQTRQWRRSSNHAGWAGPITAVYDDKRNRCWALPMGFTPPSSSYLDLSTFAFVNGPTPAGVSGYDDNAAGAYHRERDIVIMATVLDVGEFSSVGGNWYWFGAGTNGTARTPVAWTNGAAPIHGNYGRGSLKYIRSAGKLIWYSRWLPDAYFEIAVPANPANPWTWVQRAITGVLPSTLDPIPQGSMYSRWDHMPALSSMGWPTGQSSNIYDHFGGRVFGLRIS